MPNYRITVSGTSAVVHTKRVDKAIRKAIRRIGDIEIDRRLIEGYPVEIIIELVTEEDTP